MTPAAPVRIPTAAGTFTPMRYRFTTGLRAGEVAHIRNESDQVVLSYRSFASAAGVVAALVSGIVFVAGLAAVLFLVAEGSPFRAAAALLLTFIFSFGIALLVPRVHVTLYDDGTPALTIVQTSAVGGARYAVSTPNGATLAVLRKGAFSRLGRNRWQIMIDGRLHGEAFEESFGRALMRKFFGKFSRSFESDFRIVHGGLDAGRIVRRPNEHGEMDVLELTTDAIDRRVAVALATLILGREP